MTSSELDRASEWAFEQLEATGGDLGALPEVPATVVIIYSAQGVIDNGGFRYFFEADFPGKPPYSVFAAAYRRIGAAEAAEAIEAAVARFPFREPEKHVDERNEFMNALSPDDELFVLGDRVCGDGRIWSLLERYCAERPAEFAGRRGGRTRR